MGPGEARAADLDRRDRSFAMVYRSRVSRPGWRSDTGRHQAAERHPHQARGRRPDARLRCELRRQLVGGDTPVRTGENVQGDR